eukprot:CAMPEP_0197658042 /NCGR_PEP_ID=MMETSP1338-20131121/44996_1 /TAXON_ID=43686 ORGANISM="Pelagodinium beii, Strain RCC1491" /NCGR_SAMPLE_ID=MMETSP1338 /ASSEMBLY_ACC=CAM_ASM_000754 /LENGTH=285 /DNA_ID=CAMNT_0043234541 /DNA_START=57 /DNA_END=914 /DNA_ORIENTATION=-
MSREMSREVSRKPAESDSDSEGSSDGGSFLQEMLEGFTPTQIGNCLVKLWTMRGRKGLKGWSEGSGFVCPITCAPFNRPCLLADGNMYEEGAAMEWLQKNDTSPSTGAKLQHKKVLRLGPVQEVIDIFLERRLGYHVLSESLEDAIKEAQQPGINAGKHVAHLRSLIRLAEGELKKLEVLMDKARKLVKILSAEAMCKAGRDYLQKLGYQPEEPIKSPGDRDVSDMDSQKELKDDQDTEDDKKEDTTDAEKSDRETKEKKEKKEKKESEEAKKDKKDKKDKKADS